MNKGLIIFGLISAFSIAAVCEGIEPGSVEMDYGTSYKLAKFGQILNPDAEKNLEPVEGLDGVAAQAALNKYRKSFEKPEEKPAYIMGIQTNR